MNKKILIGIIVVFFIVGCVVAFKALQLVDPDPTPRPTLLPKADDTGATQEGIENIVKANNQFALDFYADLEDREAGNNIFFSPYSISTALTMTYEGARNQTAAEIQSVFHFPENDTIRRSSVAAV